ncbi:ATP-binding protein [Streptomyces sp. NPDC058335]|uniref:ATP-binding protein n=1 Tax=Streptomyces sp. NPDC058335 TaxID=3346451 RepID=UPI0036538389
MNVWTCVGSPAVPPVDDDGPADALIGRERESAALGVLLSEHHLVTVTGRPGVGKSRLAAEAAARTGGPWRRVVHVRWQGTGPGGPGALTAAVSQALTGRRPHRRETDIAALVRQLPATGVLLFLDDVDPVHRECMGLVQRLLVAVPGLRVLVTSRRVLGLGEEQVLPLPPLATSAQDAAPDRSPAVELFLRRARTVLDTLPTATTAGDPRTAAAKAPPEAAEPPTDTAAPHARPSESRPHLADLRAVEAICHTLEGVPHAIELAAEQVARQPVEELADLLENHQCWLSSDRPPLLRHRSLRDTVGATYALCEREARIVWGRASAFTGPFNESTAVFLCAGGGVEPHQVPSLLVQLTAVNVLEPVRDPGGLGQPRYRMTRAAREFGAERLREAGECEVALERRAAHCRQIAAVAENLWASGCQDQAARLVQEEQAELTSMLRQALCRPDQAETALETVVSLWFWWAVFDHGEEGRGYLLQLLPLCPAGSDTGMRGRLLAAWLGAGCDPQGARALLGRAWPAAVMAGDDATVGHIAHVQGLIALHEGDHRAAADHFEEAARTTPDHAFGGPPPAVSLAARAVAQAAFAPAAARRTARRALTRSGVRDDAWAALVARYAKAFVDHHQGRSAGARNRARRALATLDGTLPASHVGVALRALAADIESGTKARPHLPQTLLYTGPRRPAPTGARRPVTR